MFHFNQVFILKLDIALPILITIIVTKYLITGKLALESVYYGLLIARALHESNYVKMARFRPKCILVEWKIVTRLS